MPTVFFLTPKIRKYDINSLLLWQMNIDLTNQIVETVLYNRYMGNTNIAAPINKKHYIYFENFCWYKVHIIRELGAKKIEFINSISISFPICASILTERITPLSDLVPRFLFYHTRYKIVQQFLRRCIVIYRTRILKKRQLIAREKGKPDILCDIWYHPVYDAYFAAAFSGNFKGGFEGDRLVIKCIKEGTTQEAVRIVCLQKTEPWAFIPMVHQYLYDSCQEKESLKKAVQDFMTLSEKWFLPRVGDAVTRFIQDYLDQTLYKLNKTNSLERLRMFIERSPVMAEYIWETNFETKESRRVLGIAMNISSKNMKGFVESHNITDLQQFIGKKHKINNSDLLETVPLPLKNEIEQCQKKLAAAKEGVRVGLHGRYISSDGIDAANTNLRNAWRKIDRWMATQHNTMHQGSR